MKLKSCVFVIFSALMCTYSLAGSELPELGDASAADLSPLAERKLGENIMREIRWKEPTYLDDAEVEGYLNRIGGRLAASSENPEQDFFFFGIRDNSINAFALPGGYIGVHTGLINAVTSESEFAGVLGHEIGHVTQHHIARTVAQQNRVGMAMLAGMLAGIAAIRANPQVAQAAIVGSQAAAIQSQLSYSRDFEREADRAGVQTLERAGFDVRSMASFFERLRKQTRVYETNLPVYMRTHPLTEDRITDMENRVGQMRYKQVVDSPDFLLVQAKIRSEEGPPAEAIKQFEVRLSKSETSTPADHYGLARAQLRGAKPEAAQTALKPLLDQSPWSKNPMVATLQAEIYRAQKNDTAALSVLDTAYRQASSNKSLLYAYTDLLVDTGKSKLAAELLQAASQKTPGDARVWERLAKAQFANKKMTAQHRAQAELYVLQDQIFEAINQLEQAQKAQDADFYEMSAVDARLGELRKRYQQMLKDKELRR